MTGLSIILGHKKMFLIITSWSYHWAGRKAGFPCILLFTHPPSPSPLPTVLSLAVLNQASSQKKKPEAIKKQQEQQQLDQDHKTDFFFA